MAWIKKWQTIIKAHVVVKITSGYLLRLFCVGFNFLKKCSNQIQMTSYVQHQQVHQICKKMMEIMTWNVQTNDLKELVNKLIPDSFGKDIEKSCQCIYLLHDVFIRKEKMLKKPKFELGKLMELHGEVVVLEKLLGVRQVLMLNGMMDTSHQSKNLFKMLTFNGDKQKILLVEKKNNEFCQ